MKAAGEILVIYIGVMFLAVYITYLVIKYRPIDLEKEYIPEFVPYIFTMLWPFEIIAIFVWLAIRHIFPKLDIALIRLVSLLKYIWSQKPIE